MTPAQWTLLATCLALLLIALARAAWDMSRRPSKAERNLARLIADQEQAIRIAMEADQ